MSRNEAEEAVLLFILSQVFLGILMEPMLAKFGLLIDRTSSIYLQVRLKNLTSVIFFLVFENILYKLCLIDVYEKVYKQRGTVCSHKDADDLLKDVRSELDQYMYVNKRFNV